jgi:hypothetical protein
MYLLDEEKLQKGDIILLRTSTRKDKIIRQATGSDYSHAMLYVGGFSCIDSDGPGVQAHNIERILFENPDDGIVIRLKQPLDEDLLYQIIDFARSKIGTEYSLEEARATLYNQSSVAKYENRQFCTRFVAKAYEAGGIRIVNNPDYCTPKEIHESNLLVPIRDIMRPANEHEIAYANEDVTSLTKQIEIQNSILKSIRDHTGADIQDFTQLEEYLAKHSVHDDTIIDIFERSGYLEMWKGDLDENPWYYDYEKFLEIPTDEDRNRIAKMLLKIEKENLHRISQNLLFYENAFAHTKRKYYRKMGDLYTKLFELSMTREIIAKRWLSIEIDS